MYKLLLAILFMIYYLHCVLILYEDLMRHRSHKFFYNLCKDTYNLNFIILPRKI